VPSGRAAFHAFDKALNESSYEREALIITQSENGIADFASFLLQRSKMIGPIFTL
jgi:hypothetical protein